MTGSARDVLAVTNCRLHPEGASLSRGAHLRVRNFLCRPLQTGRPGTTRSAAAGNISHRSCFEISVVKDAANMLVVIRHNQRSEVVHIAGVAIYENITSNFLAD